jgi:hypothetical protein
MDPFAALKNTCPKISPWANTEGLKFGRGLIFRISYGGRSTQEGLYLGSVIGAYIFRGLWMRFQRFMECDGLSL